MSGRLFNLTFDYMKITQGDIFLADLNPVRGHEQAGFRPVLILQNDILNENLSTVVIAPITKNLHAKGLMTTFFLYKKVSKLNHDSIVLLFQVRTLDKVRLTERISIIPAPIFMEAKRQLQQVF